MFPEWMCWRMLHVFSVVKSNLLMFQSTCSWFLIHSFPQNLCKVNKLPCASFIRVFVKTTIKLQIQVMCELWGKHQQALDNKQDFEITKENMGLKQQDILNTDRLRLKKHECIYIDDFKFLMPCNKYIRLRFWFQRKIRKAIKLLHIGCQTSLNSHGTHYCHHPSSIILIIIGS